MIRKHLQIRQPRLSSLLQLSSIIHRMSVLPLVVISVLLLSMLIIVSVVSVAAEIPVNIYVNQISPNQIEIIVCDNGTQLVNSTCVPPVIPPPDINYTEDFPPPYQGKLFRPPTN